MPFRAKLSLRRSPSMLSKTTPTERRLGLLLCPGVLRPGEIKGGLRVLRSRKGALSHLVCEAAYLPEGMNRGYYPTLVAGVVPTTS